MQDCFRNHINFKKIHKELREKERCKEYIENLCKCAL